MAAILSVCSGCSQQQTGGVSAGDSECVHTGLQLRPVCLVGQAVHQAGQGCSTQALPGTPLHDPQAATCRSEPLPPRVGAWLTPLFQLHTALSLSSNWG